MQRIFLIGIAMISLFMCIIFFQSIYPQNENMKETEQDLDTDQVFSESTAPFENNQHLTGGDHMYESEQLVERKYDSDEFQAGINLFVYGHPDMANARYLFEKLRDLGLNSLAIVFPLFQEGWQADYVKTDSENTPTIAELADLIDEAHSQGLSVALRPILDEQSIMSSGKWRGTIQPRNPEAWFESYRSLMLEYAELSEASGVKWFNIGTEFNSLQRYNSEWIKLIQSVRKIYQGKLMYSFNWNSVHDIPKSKFVSHLDYVGIDAYFPLDAPDNATVEMLKESWKTWIDQLNDILSDQNIVITEAGIIPVAGAYRTPYAGKIPGGKIDWQVQAHYYEATYATWRPLIEGIYWWAVTLDEPDSNSIDFSPLGSPTETVIQKHFLKTSDN